MTEAFYQRLGPARYRPTPHTSSPWGPDMQHLGPPSALLTLRLEQLDPRQDTAIRRISIDALGAVPLSDLDVEARVVRAGRTVELIEARMHAAGRPVLRATAWRTAIGDTIAVHSAPPPMPPPETAQHRPPPRSWHGGYVDAVEWRWLRSDLNTLGPGTAWLRLKIPIVDGEQPTPTQRLMAIADSANGVGACISIQSWIYTNVDLTVHLHRTPSSEWVGLDSETTIGPDGAGVCSTTIHDLDGAIGTAAQLLTVRPRASRLPVTSDDHQARQQP